MREYLKEWKKTKTKTKKKKKKKKKKLAVNFKLFIRESFREKGGAGLHWMRA